MKTKAIIIIYPNGYVDSLEICEKLEHIDYYKKLLLKSECFIKLCKNCNFDMGIHIHIDRILAISGAIVFFNWNIKEIIHNVSFLYNDLPGFIVALPETTLTKEQVVPFKEIIKNYPKEKIEFNKYNSKENDFLPYKYEDLLKDIEIDNEHKL